MTEQVWILDDDTSIRWVLEKACKNSKLTYVSFSSGSALLEALESNQPKVIISDIRMPNLSGFDLLAKVKLTHPKLPIIIMTAHSDLDNAVKAYQAGAFDYLPKPFDVDEAISLLQKAIVSNTGTQTSVPQQAQDEIIGEAGALQDVFRAIGRLSNSTVSVLIYGQSGTGKELIARALHKHSPRKDGPFIDLNMGAIPKDLLESELFGHAKGAFTGAIDARKGRFAQADGGTLFLDEIGDMPFDAQTRLLRVLAENQFYPVGSSVLVKVNVRIIAATHQDLEAKVQQGKFREDLFHRLNVINLHLPPLCARKEDIETLTNHFLSKTAQELNVTPKILTKEALAKLEDFSWPGNIRQLENVCKWLTVMAAGNKIAIDDLPKEIFDSVDKVVYSWQDVIAVHLNNELQQNSNALIEFQAKVEKLIMQVALKKSNGHKQNAAKLLGWGRNTLTRKSKS